MTTTYADADDYMYHPPAGAIKRQYDLRTAGDKIAEMEITIGKLNVQLVALEAENTDLQRKLNAVPEYAQYCHLCFSTQEEPMPLAEWIAEGIREAEEQAQANAQPVVTWESAWHAMTGEWPGEEVQP